MKFADFYEKSSKSPAKPSPLVLALIRHLITIGIPPALIDTDVDEIRIGPDYHNISLKVKPDSTFWSGGEFTITEDGEA